ncbi:MAG: (2Fe-2S)-binding protein [Deltaproteobacteria bacterium]|nr:(2Fe-2S)-binding protein [Deltaproteobacteria bacterium]
MVELVVNGAKVEVPVEATDRLLDVLRGPLGLTGTKEGCGAGECGACTVLVDGRAVNACLYPAREIEGRAVTTIEGLGEPSGALSDVQQAFVERGAIQCGFCSPGMILAATALLAEHPEPTDEQIRDGLVGNLCRCTGYVQIVEAVRTAAARRAGGGTR